MAVMIDYGHGKIVRTRGSFGVEDVRGFDEFMNDLLVSWPFEAEKKCYNEDSKCSLSVSHFVSYIGSSLVDTQISFILPSLFSSILFLFSRFQCLGCLAGERTSSCEKDWVMPAVGPPG